MTGLSTAVGPRIEVGGVPVDLCNENDAVDAIIERAIWPANEPLFVASINLDHVHHFGTGGRWRRTLDRGDWLCLADGKPIITAAKRVTGRTWPRVAGSDLAEPLLRRCEADRLRVGFVGGSAETQQQLAEKLEVEYSSLVVAGMWSPRRAELESPSSAAAIADEIARADVDMLFVGLGKPRQELWIEGHGTRSGALVLLAFGAVVDFLAGRVGRAPEVARTLGLEWAWRLAIEPRRLANRYLVEGPVAYGRTRWVT
jgi:exopolysaccharide biosynthesis WecB/TagA/CpsF family protein